MSNQNKDWDWADPAWSDRNMRGGANLWSTTWTPVQTSLWLEERSPRVGGNITADVAVSKTKLVWDQYNFCALEVEDRFQKNNTGAP